MKITFLCGLPGSGKTHLGEHLASLNGNVVYLDDITVKGGLKQLIDVLGREEIVVSDVFLCRSRDREAAIKILNKIAPQYEIEWVFFENNPDKCLKNMEYRYRKGDPRSVKNMILDMSKEYAIPKGVVVKEIWQSNQT